MSHFAFQNGCLTEILDFLMLTLLLTTEVFKHILFKIKNTTTIKKLKWGNCMMQWEPLWSSFPLTIKGSSRILFKKNATHTHTHPCITVFWRLWIPDWDLTPLPKLFPRLPSSGSWWRTGLILNTKLQQSTISLILNDNIQMTRYYPWLQAGIRQE